MKKLNLLLVAIALVGFIALGACKSNTSKLEDVANQLEEAMEEAAEEMEEALEEAEEAIEEVADTAAAEEEEVEEAPAE